jgi:hypothetical protein
MASQIQVMLESGHNDSNKFTTKLAQSLVLDTGEEWEMGLREIIAPQTWDNVTVENKRFFYYHDGAWLQGEIAEGYYGWIPEIFSGIKTAMVPEARPNFSFDHNSFSRKVEVILNEGAKLAFASPTPSITDEAQREETPASALGLMLGFETDKQLTEKKNKAKHSAILDPVQNLYLYCDCIRPVLVGDTVSQLLKTVPVTLPRPNCVVGSYNAPSFVPVSKHVIDRISIDVRSSDGILVPFKGGKTYLKLIFRPRRVQ